MVTGFRRATVTTWSGWRRSGRRPWTRHRSSMMTRGFRSSEVNEESWHRFGTSGDQLEMDAAEVLDLVVPKGGLEPPHPRGHMTLNHARLPIPPLRLGQGLHLTDRGYEVKGPAASRA